MLTKNGTDGAVADVNARSQKERENKEKKRTEKDILCKGEKKKERFHMTQSQVR